MADRWRVWKDVCYPGAVSVPDPRDPRRRRTITFTDADLEAMERTGNEKLADAWQVPLTWEHQEAWPARLSRGERDRDFALGVFGSVEGFRRENGRLQALLAGDDPADLDQFRKVKFVSPQIDWDWTDSDGKLWAGPTVTHVAATPRPVQRHQEPVGARLSQTAGNSGANRTPTARRVGAEKGVRVGSRVGGVTRIRLSLADYVEPPMPDEFPGNKEKKGSAWQRIAAALEQAGIRIGDGANVKDPDHLADLIEVACMNSEQAAPEDENPLPDEDAEQQQPGDMEAPPEGTTEPPPPTVQMSLEASRKANTVLSARLISAERDRLLRRAERVAKSGALSPPAGDALVEEVRTVRLSLTDAGELRRNDTITRLEALEQVRPGTTWKPKGTTRLSQPANARPAEASPYEDGSPQDDDAAVEEYERHVGRRQ